MNPGIHNPARPSKGKVLPQSTVGRLSSTKALVPDFNPPRLDNVKFSRKLLQR